MCRTHTHQTYRNLDLPFQYKPSQRKYQREKSNDSMSESKSRSTRSRSWELTKQEWRVAARANESRSKWHVAVRGHLLIASVSVRNDSVSESNGGFHCPLSLTRFLNSTFLHSPKSSRSDVIPITIFINTRFTFTSAYILITYARQSHS